MAVETWITWMQPCREGEEQGLEQLLLWVPLLPWRLGHKACKLGFLPTQKGCQGTCSSSPSQT